MANTISVSALNLYVKSILESDNVLPDVAVEGEISNFVNHYKSGHYYFALKDDKALIKTVMFSFDNRKLKFVPENGMKVIIRGKVSLYEKDGTYQLYAKDLFLSGVGAQQIAFELLKEKLNKEGLFLPEHKKKLPKYPFKIGVATSATGAALHDIVSVAQRRFPCAEITLAPCGVQGANAEESIVSAIQNLDADTGIEVIIIARGGGSTEDLWVFNSEKIARAAFACKKPTVSAVGHEIDFSILDFVCDVRAATPTAAAEIALPDISALSMQLLSYERAFSKHLYGQIDAYKNQLLLVQHSKGFTKVVQSCKENQERLKNLHQQMKQLMILKVSSSASKIEYYTKILETQSPINSLKKGYGLVYQNSHLLREQKVQPGQKIKVVTYLQELDCTVTDAINREGQK